jgi:hypothetical protein
MDLNEQAKYNIEFLKSNINKIKLPLYSVKGFVDIYTIKEFKKINNSFFIIYTNAKDREFHSNIYDINFIFLENIYRKVLDQFKNKNIWED